MSQRHTFGRAAQQLAAAVLLVAFAAAPALAAGVGTAEPECSMACCKRKRNPLCCKRHSHEARHAPGAYVRGTLSCATSCTVPAAPAAALVWIGRPEAQSIRTEIGARRPMAPSAAPGGSAPCNPFLYQRPPPNFFLPLQIAA